MLTQQSLPVAFALTFIGAVTMVGGVSVLRARGWTTPLQGRKLMHLATGPVFILCWLLFPTSDPLSRYYAAFVPFTVALYMLSNALGYTRNAGLINTVSRTGLAGELSKGPFYYGLIHAIAAAVYWTDSPTGLVSLIILCVGDGVSDLIGRPYGKTKWPWNREKSVEGSLAFVIASVAVLFIYVPLFQDVGFFRHVPWFLFRLELPIVVVLSALVESLKLGNFDNVGIFVAVAIMGHFLGW